MRQLQGYNDEDIRALIKTNMGDIEVVLFPEIAPKAVENFSKLSEDGYYDGVIFHRVIEDFMIQGGDPTGTGMGGESIYGQSFDDEFDINYRNFYGALSMANAGPSTNGSQFFIVTAKDIPANIFEQMEEFGEEGGYPQAVIDGYRELGGAFWLDFKHTVFGHVIAGMDVVEEISQVKKDHGDRPLYDISIENIEIVK